MCLLAIAHRATSRFPLVIAANRDEDYQRPTYEAHHWEAAPDVVGGVDGLHGGSWLAVRRGGRFAAVTNLRGAERRKRSRGFLVRDFVTSDVSPEEYAEQIAGDAGEYPGFHLVVGDVEGTLMYIAPDVQVPLAPGVHAFSNAPQGEEWPKVRAAIDELESVLDIAEEEPLIDELLRFLWSPRGTAALESEVFIPGQRYGTRSSTVIVASQTEILFAEQSFASGGVPHGARRLFCLVR